MFGQSKIGNSRQIILLHSSLARCTALLRLVSKLTKYAGAKPISWAKPAYFKIYSVDFKCSGSHTGPRWGYALSARSPTPPYWASTEVWSHPTIQCDKSLRTCPNTPYLSLYHYKIWASIIMYYKQHVSIITPPSSVTNMTKWTLHNRRFIEISTLGGQSKTVISFS
jgi:hypothetical protein